MPDKRKKLFLGVSPISYIIPVEPCLGLLEYARIFNKMNCLFKHPNRCTKYAWKNANLQKKIEKEKSTICAWWCSRAPRQILCLVVLNYNLRIKEKGLLWSFDQKYLFLFFITKKSRGRDRVKG